MRHILATSLIMGTLMGTSLALADTHNSNNDFRWRPTPAPKKVPELNAEAAGAALALVIGGVAVVLGRRRRANKTP
jgi:hypothetical protein